MISVRQACREDCPALFAFLREAYPDRWQFKVAERWQWQFESNPYCRGGSLPVWLAFDGDRIVGQSCALQEPLALNGTDRCLGWSVDTVVLEPYRRQGIGTELQRANQEAHDCFASLSMSPTNRRIKERLGAVRLGPVTRLELRLEMDRGMVGRRIGKWSPLLARIGASVGMDRVLAAGASLAARIGWKLRNQAIEPVFRHLTFEPVVRFAEWVSVLWNQAASAVTFAVPRTATWLNWKLLDQPHRNYSCWKIAHRGAPCGLIALCLAPTPNARIGLIAEVLCNPTIPRLQDMAIAWGVRQLVARGACEIRLLGSTSEMLESARRNGFRAVGEIRPMLWTRGLVPIPERIHVSYADHDLDQSPLRVAS